MLKREKSEYAKAFERLRWVRYKLANRRKTLTKLRKSINDLKEAEKSLLIAIREIKQSNSRKCRSHEQRSQE